MTLNEFESKMTIFYSKRTGEIQTFCTGGQDMSLFSKTADDYSIIWDYVVVVYDSFVIKNIYSFVVNTTTKELSLKENSLLSQKFN